MYCSIMVFWLSLVFGACFQIIAANALILWTTSLSLSSLLTSVTLDPQDWTFPALRSWLIVLLSNNEQKRRCENPKVVEAKFVFEQFLSIFLTLRVAAVSLEWRGWLRSHFFLLPCSKSKHYVSCSAELGWYRGVGGGGIWNTSMFFNMLPFVWWQQTLNVVLLMPCAACSRWQPADSWCLSVCNLTQ